MPTKKAELRIKFTPTKSFIKKVFPSKLPRKTDFFLKAKDLFLRSYFDIKSIKLCLRQNLT